MEHGAYRSEDAQAHIDALRGQLEKTIKEKVTAQRQVTMLTEERTFAQKHGLWMFVISLALCCALVILIGVGLCPPIHSEVEVRYQTIERSCTVEHAVRAEVDEAVRRALIEERMTQEQQ